MTVGDLIAALHGVPRNKRVLITYSDEDERAATFVTLSQSAVHICDSAKEKPGDETVLFPDNAE